MNNEPIWYTDIFTLNRDNPSELLELLKNEYGDVDPSKEEYFNWCCKDNPAGEAIIPIVRDSRTNELIGECWFILQKARISGEDCVATNGISLIIHSKYRGRRLVADLIKKADEEMARKNIDFAIVVPNDKSIKVVPVINKHIIGEQDFMFRPLDWSFLSHLEFFEFKYLRKLIINTANRVWPLIFRPKKIDQDISDCRVEEITHFGEDFDEFWFQVKDKYPNMLRRDREILNWRFVEHPTREYHLYTVREEQKAIGYLVIRTAKFRGFPAGFIVDFLVEPTEKGSLAGDTLITEAINQFQSHNVDLVVALSRTSFQEGQILRRNGFIKLPNKFNRMPLVPHQLVYSDRVSISNIEDNDKWFFQLGDFDYV
jgi:hypothetical protein